MRNCENCQKETKNPKFCSRNCSATYTNTTHPRRKRKNKCKKCRELIISGYTYCYDCWYNRGNLSEYSLKKLKEEKLYSQSYIGDNARRIYKQSDKNKFCENCKYTEHYEVCHIKPINSFSDSSLLLEINNIDNLIALCPNCHWEFDNGYLTIKIIKEKNNELYKMSEINKQP